MGLKWVLGHVYFCLISLFVVIWMMNSDSSARTKVFRQREGILMRNILILQARIQELQKEKQKQQTINVNIYKLFHSLMVPERAPASEEIVDLGEERS